MKTVTTIKDEQFTLLPSSTTVCFTGLLPRNMPEYLYSNRDAYQPLRQALTEYCESLYKQGYRQFISGGAQGVDQLAFWAVAHLKSKIKRETGNNDIKNVVFIPWKQFNSKWNETGLFSKNDFRKIEKYADAIISTADNKIFAEENTNVYHIRNHAMVNNSSFVFGVYFDYNSWITAESSADNGTMKTLKYAKEQNKTIAIMQYNKPKKVYLYENK